MNKWTFRSLAAAAVGLLALAGQAHAAVSYSYVAESPNYQATPGVATTVRLYLLETLTAGSTSVITADGGLGGFGIQVNRPAAGSSSITGFDFNGAEFAAYPNAAGRPVPTASNIKFSAGAFSPVQPGNLGGRFTDTSVNPPLGTSKTITSPSLANRVFVGDVYITPDAVALPGSQTTFQLLPYSTTAGGNSLTFATPYDLDFNNATAPIFTGAVNSTSSFTVTVVPEPTAGALLVLGAIGSVIRRRRSQA